MHPAKNESFGAALPPSLAVVPNIPWEKQSLEQLRAERDYWADKMTQSAGSDYDGAADNSLRSCEAWIHRRKAETG